MLAEDCVKENHVLVLPNIDYNFIRSQVLDGNTSLICLIVPSGYFVVCNKYVQFIGLEAWQRCETCYKYIPLCH